MATGRGYLTLSDIAARTPVLDVACRRCPRRGRYHTAKLIERYGPDKPGPELLREMSADCPRRLDPHPSLYERCGVCNPGLPALFGVVVREGGGV